MPASSIGPTGTGPTGSHWRYKHTGRKKVSGLAVGAQPFKLADLMRDYDEEAEVLIHVIQGRSISNI